MNLVRESINFTRGLDPKTALSVGMDHILSAPFEYDLIPDGKYILWSSKNKSLEESGYSCLGEKIGSIFYMVSSWSTMTNGIPHNVLHDKIGYKKYHSDSTPIWPYPADNIVADNSRQFKEWAIDQCSIDKLQISSDEEFKKLLEDESS